MPLGDAAMQQCVDVHAGYRSCDCVLRCISVALKIFNLAVPAFLRDWNLADQLIPSGPLGISFYRSRSLS